MIQCPKCGHENPDNSKFCDHCGNPLTAPSVPENPQPVTTPQKNSKKKGLWIGLAVVLVLILGIGVILWMNSGDKASSQKTETDSAAGNTIPMETVPMETVTMENFSVNPYRTETSENDDGSYTETYYDAQDRRIGEAYFDTNGKPRMSDEGYAKATCQYDAQGNVIEAATFGTDGKPCMNKYGFAKITRKYDAQGNKIEEVFYDEKGNVIER